MKKRPYLHADAHVLARAKLSQSDLDRINAPLKENINAMQAEEASMRSDRSVARTHRSRCSPPSNTGGKIDLRVEGGKLKQVLERKHYASKTCFIDWIGFTIHESTFEILSGAISDKELITSVSIACESIFGFGITSKRDAGMNFYQTSYVLGDKFGMVCYGGQRNTVHIFLSGQGCEAARGGWERRLYDFLKSATGSTISRIDLAHDDIKGDKFSVESLDQAYEEGGFNNGGRNPDIEHRGNWKHPTGKGRTLYVGHRSNGRYFRGYEKGKQLGDPDSPWIRLEVQFKGIDRIIPFEILKYPHEYYAAAYPILIPCQLSWLATQQTV